MNSSNPKKSLTTEFFEQLYQENPDPWQFATSEYEAKKYAATLNALPRNLYKAGFEIGGSIGILTEKLARRCQALLSIDVSQIAQDQAIDRCRHLNNIKFELMSVPESFPTASFDLIVLSEVGYYWSWEDLRKAQGLIVDRLRPQGHLLLVHWIADRGILSLTGDEVHNDFLELVPDHLRRIKSLTQDKYRLDLFEKS
jgi:SAM-dependent methyltransferase